MESLYKKYKIQKKLAPYLFILPNTIIFLIFVIVPSIYGIIYSFTDFDGLSKPNFVGLGNYINILSNPDFWSVFERTLIYVILVVPLIYLFSLLIAMLLSKEFKFKGLFRAVIYWPSMISFIIIGLTWKWIFSESGGILNYILVLLKLHPVEWFTNPINANITIILATLWSRIGFYMVIFIAGLKNIPKNYYEAASIDGANKFQMFRNITLPLLKPTSFLVIILAMIEAFKAYPLVLSLTDGGPGNATTYIVQYIYQFGFQKSELGYASAMSVILFLILGILIIIQYKFSKGGSIQ